MSRYSMRKRECARQRLVVVVDITVVECFQIDQIPTVFKTIGIAIRDYRYRDRL